MPKQNGLDFLGSPERFLRVPSIQPPLPNPGEAAGHPMRTTRTILQTTPALFFETPFPLPGGLAADLKKLAPKTKGLVALEQSPDQKQSFSDRGRKLLRHAAPCRLFLQKGYRSVGTLWLPMCWHLAVRAVVYQHLTILFPGRTGSGGRSRALGEWRGAIFPSHTLNFSNQNHPYYD